MQRTRGPGTADARQTAGAARRPGEDVARERRRMAHPEVEGRADIGRSAQKRATALKSASRGILTDTDSPQQTDLTTDLVEIA